MGFEPQDPKQMGRLWEAQRASRNALKVFRENRVKALKQLVGYHYSKDGAGDKVPLNVIELAYNTHMQLLAARRPKALCTTRDQMLKGEAADLTATLDEQMERMRLLGTLRDGIGDALFCMGVAKVGVDPEADDGSMYCESIDLDDWVHDMRARKLAQVSFCGHRYEMDLEEAQEFRAFNSKLRKELRASDENTEHNDGGDARPNTISRGESAMAETYRDTVTLWEFYLPKEQLLVTVPEDRPKDVLWVRQWKGIESETGIGPYHLLRFTPIASQVMPLAPIMSMLDLHMPLNQMLRKIIRKAENIKDLTLVRSDAVHEAQKLIDARDQEVVPVTDPSAFNTMRFNGVDAASLAGALQLKELFSWSQGNLDAYAGLGPQSGTASQDQLIATSAAQRINYMRGRVLEWTRDIVRCLAWYILNDPVHEYSGFRNERMFNMSVPAVLTPESIRGQHQFYRFDIEPYSMADRSPEQHLQNLIQYVTQVYMPMAQVAMQQGVTLDFGKLSRLYEQYTGTNEISDVIRFQTPDPEAQMPEGMAQAGGGRHEYVRRNVQGATPGKARAMIASMLGAGVQQSELEGSMRQTG
jgi:hypothetical protein